MVAKDFAAQWIQWLRHTREQAPSIQEQQYEVSRQAMMKQLAAEADERWRSTPRYIDGPARQQPSAPTAIRENEKPSEEQIEVGDVAGVKSIDEEQHEIAESRDAKDMARERKPKNQNPWQQRQTGAPSENWQPEAWSPGVAQRR